MNFIVTKKTLFIIFPGKSNVEEGTCLGSIYPGGMSEGRGRDQCPGGGDKCRDTAILHFQSLLIFSMYIGLLLYDSMMLKMGFLSYLFIARLGVLLNNLRSILDKLTENQCIESRGLILPQQPNTRITNRQ